MRWRTESKVTPAPGWVEPCIPTVAKVPPADERYVFEVKHDGYRLLVRKAEGKVRIYSRRGADFTKRFPRIVDAVQRLRATSMLIDGEGVVCNADGLAIFDELHGKQRDHDVSLCAFDLLELNGVQVRQHALLDRKKRLMTLVSKVRDDSIVFNEHLEGDGPRIFEHACKLGCEGIIAKRVDLPYESGRSKRWLKIKNPNSPAARRADEGTF